MKSTIKSFIIGALCGSVLLGSVGYASDKLQIDVKLPYIPYVYDGQELSLGDGDTAPQTIHYKSVNYVSVRALAEALNKEVSWDEAEGKVLIHSMTRLGFEVIDSENMTPEIEAWVTRSLNKQATLIKSFAEDTYILHTLGERRSGGYEINITEIKQYYDGITVIADITKPQKGMYVTGEITYPYQLVKVSGQHKGPVKIIIN